MKVYISAAKVSKLKEQYKKKIPETKIDELVQLDPTANISKDFGGKYSPWILKQFLAGNINDSNLGNVHDVLYNFNRIGNTFPSANIYDYKTFRDLHDAEIDVMENRTQSTRERKRMIKQMLNDEGDEEDAIEELALEEEEDENAFTDSFNIADGKNIKFLVSDGQWDVYTPLTWPGSIALAFVGVDKTKDYSRNNPPNMKAKWCTAYDNDRSYYDGYTKDGPLYVFIPRNDPINKYQSCPSYHRGPCWWFNKKDDEEGKQAWLNFCAEHPIIADYFDVRSEGGVQYMANSIMGYDNTAEEIRIPDGFTKLPNYEIPASCKTLILPDSMTEIAAGAFKGKRIETVIFNNVKTISSTAFMDSAIRNINLSSVSKIGSSAFRNCKNLTAVNLDNVTFLGAHAFAECTSLNTTWVHNSGTTLALEAFANCSNTTIVWEDADEDYDFTGIKLLVMDKDKCPKLFDENVGYVNIQTPDGTLYEAER